MSPLEDVLPVSAEFLHKDLAVADVVYNPKETLLLKKAKEAGCRQGAAAFELFTGKEMPAQEVMENFFK